MNPISMEVNLEDLEPDLPTPAQLEHFAQLGRLGRFSEAKSYFRENLRMYTDVFPVVAENASLLLDQNAYGDLRDFLSKALKGQEQQQSSPETSAEESQQTPYVDEDDCSDDTAESFAANEISMMQLLYSLCILHTEGLLYQVIERMRYCKEQSLQGIAAVSPQRGRDSTSEKLQEVPRLEDTEIQIILMCVQIAMLAATQSNWVSLEDFRLPWTSTSDPQTVWLDIENWCLNLALDGRKEATDLLNVLLQGYLNPQCLPQKSETAKEHASQFANYGYWKQVIGTDHSSLFEIFIKTVGDCDYNEGRLLLRFAAREAYCSLLRDHSQMEMAAELLDPMKSDIDLLSQLDLDMKFSRQYLQWGFLQNTLLEHYNGFNTTPRLEELLPVAESLSDYPMQQRLFEQVGRENRVQIVARDYRFAETSFFRNMRCSEIILENRIVSVLELANLIYDEYHIIDSMSKEDEGIAAAEFKHRCRSVLNKLQTTYPTLDAPMIKHTIGKILNPNVKNIENDVPLYVREIEELGQKPGEMPPVLLPKRRGPQMEAMVS